MQMPACTACRSTSGVARLRASQPAGALLAICLLMLLVGSGRAHAGDNQWTSNGPYGGLVTVLARDPKTPANLYAAGFSGIYKSSDAGAHWAIASNGITDLTIDTIAIDPLTPTTLYAGSTQGGPIVKSTNGAQSWSPLSLTLVTALAIDPKTTTTLYAAQDQNGLSKSTDGGVSWVRLSSTNFSSFATFKSLVVDPNTTATIYAGESSTGIFKSSDGGATWNPANNGLTGPIIQVLALAIDPQNPSTLYAAANTTGGSGLFKSSDGGANWSTIVADKNNALAIETVAVDSTNSANVYIGTFAQGVKRSTNGGATFSAASGGLPQVGVSAIAINRQNGADVLIGTQNGVFASTNSGAAWNGASNGLALTSVTAVAVDPKTPSTFYAVTLGSGIFKSTDSGGSWTAINNGIGPTGNAAANLPSYTSIAIDPNTPSTLYVGSQYTQQNDVYKSTDGGATWKLASSGLPSYIGVTALAIDPVTTTNVYAGTPNDGLFQSSDGGNTWTSVAGAPTSIGSLAAGLLTTAAPSSSVDGHVTATASGTPAIYVGDPSAPANKMITFLINGKLQQYQLDIDTAKCIVGTTNQLAFYEGGKVGTAGITQIFVDCISPDAEQVGPNTVQINGYTFTVTFSSVSVGSDGPNATAANARAGNVISATTLPTVVTPWGEPDGSGAKATACSPFAQIAADPTDPASFYVGTDCGVLHGTGNGAQLASMNTGLPTGTQITSLTTSPDGVTLVAGSHAAGVFVFSKTISTSPVNVDQHGMTGVWYNPATGGQGLLVETYPDLRGSGQGYLAAGWYTFDVTAAGGQRWYTLQGPAASNASAIALDVFAATGGNFNAGPKVTASKVGTATLTFSDCATGTLAFSFNDGRIGTIPLTRADANVTCASAGDNGNAPSNYLLSGAWYDPTISGQGFFFAVNPLQNLLFAAWYTYAPTGAGIGGGASQRWYTIQDNAFAPGTKTKNGLNIYETTSGVFNSGKVSAGSPIGTANIVINSCTSIALSYAFTGGTNAGLSGSVNLGRVVGPPAGCSF